ncbi:MAG: hypothetical protein SV186_02470 [Candidatus Nanohaloarchaea archaeon]|nr:hypothetical protein [Candidatus Nanohaloarchaea archaeon]
MKGQSVLLSYAIYIGLGLSAVYIVVSSGVPILEDMQDTAAIQSQVDQLSSLADKIQRVSRQTTGAQKRVRVQIDRGSLFIENESIVYEIKTGSGIITAGSKRRFGNVVLSANAQTSVMKTTYNGTECYRMANQYIETCVKAFGTETSFEQGYLNETVLYLENHRINKTLHPDLSLAINGNSSIDAGRISARPVATGQYLGQGRLLLFVDPDGRPTYTVAVQLRSGSDFLQIEVR